MSEVYLFPSSSDPKAGLSDFSDLIPRLTDRLNQSQTVPDLETLISDLSQLMKNPKITSDLKLTAKRLRQKGYDRRRKLMAKPESESNRDEKTELLPTAAENKTTPAGKIELRPEPVANRPKRKSWIFTVAQIITMFGAALVVGGFLWHQSVQMYQSSGFTDPKVVAKGAILMVVGLSLFHAFFPSKFALICCLYAGAYEAYFVVSGTYSEERFIKAAAVQGDLSWLKENVARSKIKYLEAKNRYENPEDKVFENRWFKKNYLEPRWEEYTKSQKQLSTAKTGVSIAVSSIDHQGILKILFRIGLVALFMLIVHKFGRISSRL